MHDPTMHDPTVDARRMAALLDGRLDGDERQQLLAELTASDEALGAYADAAAVLAELEREGVVAAVSPAIVDVDIGDRAAAEAPAAGSPAAVAGQGAPVASIADMRARRRNEPRWHVPRWMALAAGIAVVVAAPALWWQGRSGGAPSEVTSYAALLASETRTAGLPAGWDGTPWRVTRGVGDSLPADARAVRIGARLTDLELAVAARDTAAVRTIAADLATLLDETTAAGATALEYRALSSAPTDNPVNLSRARRNAALIAGEEAVALGMWLEAARLAAAQRDVAFFRTEESRAALERARGSGMTQVAEAGNRVAALIPREPPTWDQLGEALTALLQALSS